MRNLLIIFTAILHLLLMNSCDILSLDDDAIPISVTPKDDDKTPVNNKLKPKSVEFFFMESYNIDGDILDYFWNNNIIYIRDNIFIDTNSIEGKVFLWIDMEVKNATPDVGMHNRKDRVSSFSLLLDSIEINSSFIDKIYVGENWAGINIKTLMDKNTFHYSSSDTRLIFFPPQIMQEDSGIITVEILVDLRNLEIFQTQFFILRCEIEY